MTAATTDAPRSRSDEALAEPGTVRERILSAAERCFYRQGITATGVDGLAEEAAVSKRTLYNHFGSKEGLVSAYLAAREERWQRRLAELLEEAGEDPLERVLAYARGYARLPAQQDGVDFRGCALVNAAAELADGDDPVLVTVQQSLVNVQRGVRQILLDAGLGDPLARRLAGQVLIVLEGAVAVGGIHRDRARALEALDLLRDLLGPHLSR
ncbi:TetR/AcrR family transcriptional regulator [Nocardioides acrostichi]|uniref:TetR/AcrR family transcriptional regulator n=1 Tax=Nocardioides acrostichi TaxID=2784339 RepID=A0A930V3Q0_9ACTN|nr:TetR/AcrR family transcriptional regulator [Nocardioides acrostichi]MBF4162649.1 TetR/AcrR family transcriptional regulator [Nocardioides acrostichi]